MEWNNDSRLSGKAFSATVDQPDLCFGLWLALFVEFDELMNRYVHPPSCLDVVEASDDDLEVLIKRAIEILNHFGMVRDFSARYPLHNEFSRDFGLVFVDILLSKQKLSIEVGEVDLVHVYHGHLSDSTHGQVLQQLAAKPSSANNEDVGTFQDVFQQVRSTNVLEIFRSKLA